jgi:hypothetical protein
VRDAAERGQLRLERRDLGPEDEATRGEDSRDGRLEVRAERCVLALEIDLRDQKPSPREAVDACPTPSRLIESRNSLS